MMHNYTHHETKLHDITSSNVLDR